MNGHFDERIFAKRMAKLNDAQREAVDAIDGPVLVVAGPGSGKTEILTLRIANILQKTDLYPSQILAVTFTDAAAVNMRRRLEEIIGPDAYRVSIYTFHGFAKSVIERYPEYFHGGAAFEPANDAYQLEVLNDIFTNLPYSSPIRSEHSEQGFVYQRDAQSVIAALKKAGLDPQDFRDVLESNKKELDAIRPFVDECFGGRIGKDIVEKTRKLLSELTARGQRRDATSHTPSLLRVYAESLKKALEISEEEGKTRALTDWKEKNTRKSGTTRVLRAQEDQEKLFALAGVYEAYLSRLKKEGYYDFEDMILDVAHALETHESLRFDLEEQFQYILVDEFQDTNDGQMRLLEMLTSSPIHEGAPNIMAVGDDDQAIYRFQGALVSNILGFKEKYKQTKVVTMTKNYRSLQSVLDLARHVIVQGEERLENLMPNLEKTLQSARSDLGLGSIEHSLFHTPSDEYAGIAERISELLEAGHPAHEIAVISRRHSDLNELLPYLHKHKIPVQYERAGDVLKEKHIRELIQMVRFVGSVARRDKSEADDLLPEVLSYPFWNINRRDVWQLSLDASSSNDGGLWIEEMQRSSHKKVRSIADFFVDLGVRSLSEPVEYILDALVGAHVDLVPDDPEGEDTGDIISFDQDGEFVSPYKEYYFSNKRFSEVRGEYLLFLANLRTFVDAIRQYRKGQLLKVEDLIEFVEIHEKNNLPITSSYTHFMGDESVLLLTAHKAKGLEFDTVFVLSALDDIWAGRGKSALLRLPPNLPIMPQQDVLDDQIRLFYVALTRARKNLYITGYKQSVSGKEVLPVRFLSGRSEPLEVEMESINLLETMSPYLHAPPFSGAEYELLKPLVENYQLSVTHYNNFLNVIQGGPQTFLEQNLLRFPQPKSISGIFGTAIHRVIEFVYRSLKQGGMLPNFDDVVAFFEKDMDVARISTEERTRLKERGKSALQVFLEQKKDYFDAEHVIEANFKNQGVVVEGAHLSGKIDTLILNDKSAHVVDYKTGSPLEKWSSSADKSWRYRNQLIFYKLLVEESRDWGEKYEVSKGSLLFVEPNTKGSIVQLDLDLEEEDVRRVRALIGKVGQRIKDLEFPDISQYPKTMKGIIQFEDDLLSS